MVSISVGLRYMLTHNFPKKKDNDDDQTNANKFANELDTPAKRYTFAEKLRAALRQSDNNYTQSTDDSYAVDISISGSIGGDEGIRYICDDIFFFITCSCTTQCFFYRA